MAIQATIKIDETSLKDAERILSSVPRAFPRAMRRAVNRTIDMAATDVNRRVRRQVNLPAREVSRGVKKFKASSGLSASLAAVPHRPSLVQFKGTRQLKRGVKYRIGSEGFKQIAHAFITEMKSGHRGVYLRRESARLPIGEREGPSIWQVITNTNGLLSEAGAKAAENLNKQMNDYVTHELRRWSK